MSALRPVGCGSVPDRIIPKTVKMVQIVSLLGTQYSGFRSPLLPTEGSNLEEKFHIGM